MKLYSYQYFYWCFNHTAILIVWWSTHQSWQRSYLYRWLLHEASSNESLWKSQSTVEELMLGLFWMAISPVKSRENLLQKRTIVIFKRLLCQKPFVHRFQWMCRFLELEVFLGHVFLALPGSSRSSDVSAKTAAFARRPMLFWLAVLEPVGVLVGSRVKRTLAVKFI